MRELQMYMVLVVFVIIFGLTSLAAWRRRGRSGDLMPDQRGKNAEVQQEQILRNQSRGRR